MQCSSVVMHTGGYERIIWQHNTMLVTMKTSELFDQFLMIARLVEEAIRICIKGPNEDADLKEVVDFILADRVAEPAAA
jgi:hypothetical protein